MDPKEAGSTTQQQTAPQNLKQPLSLKQYCFKNLLKDEESQKKVPALLKKNVLTIEIAHELAENVARSAALNLIEPIAQELPLSAYPNIGLELLCTRNDDKEKRKNIIKILSQNATTQGNESIASILQEMHLYFNLMKKENTTKEELLIFGTSHPLISERFLTFLFSKSADPHEYTLEGYFTVVEIELSNMTKNTMESLQAEPIFFNKILEEEFFKARFTNLSSDDAQKAFAYRNNHNAIYKNIQKLLLIGFRPNAEGFNFFFADYNHSLTNKETLFTHILGSLKYLRTQRGLNLKYLTMALDGLLGLEINYDTSVIIDGVSKFYKNKPENVDISYLTTELKDNPFAQKIPLAEQMVMETIEFYRDMLLLLMPYCKNEFTHHKEDLEEEFQMSLEELEKIFNTTNEKP